MVVSEAATTMGPLISWMFLPGIVTKIVLNFLYSNRILTPPTTPIQADLHKRRIQTLVIISYLFYTIYASLFHRPTNFYELLQVSAQSDTEVIRRSFRRLARIYHPDKMGGGLKNERLFIDLRTAHDCLSEPVKRMAYDRFGSVILEWTEAITLREYFTRGLQNSLAFYIINPAMFGFIHWLNGQRIINYVSRSNQDDSAISSDFEALYSGNSASSRSSSHLNYPSSLALTIQAYFPFSHLKRRSTISYQHFTRPTSL
jgi:hypothetical protein